MKLTLNDLKEQGLELSKTDAQELHHVISRIAQHGHELNEVFPGTGEDLDEEDDISFLQGGAENFVSKAVIEAAENEKITVESRIEYLNSEGFFYKEEHGIGFYEDENGAIVSIPQVEAKYEFDSDFYDLVKNIIIDSAPSVDENEDNLYHIDDANKDSDDTGNSEEQDSYTGEEQQDSQEQNEQTSEVTEVDTRSRAQKAADTRKANAAAKNTTE